MLQKCRSKSAEKLVSDAVSGNETSKPGNMGVVETPLLDSISPPPPPPRRPVRTEPLSPRQSTARAAS